jgi:hypothetical protein
MPDRLDARRGRREKLELPVGGRALALRRSLSHYPKVLQAELP